jgi:PAS domain S-box-containing protein
LLALYFRLVRQMDFPALVLCDPQGRIASWNRGCTKVFGCEEAEVTDKLGKILFTPEDVESGQFEKQNLKAADCGQVADLRWHVRKDMTRVFLTGTVIALRDDYGSLLGFAKVMADTTQAPLDILFVLPREVYERIETLTGNKQSQLLQEVRRTLLGTFPNTEISADGQAVIAPFQTYNVDIVPAFRFISGPYGFVSSRARQLPICCARRFLYPDKTRAPRSPNREPKHTASNDSYVTVSEPVAVGPPKGRRTLSCTFPVPLETPASAVYFPRSLAFAPASRWRVTRRFTVGEHRTSHAHIAQPRCAGHQSLE